MFRSHLCTKCFVGPPGRDIDLKWCAQCNHVRYCSVNCETEDAANHRTLCDALLKIKAAAKKQEKKNKSQQQQQHHHHHDHECEDDSEKIDAAFVNQMSGVTLATEVSKSLYAVSSVAGRELSNNESAVIYRHPRCTFCGEDAVVDTHGKKKASTSSSSSSSSSYDSSMSDADVEIRDRLMSNAKRFSLRDGYLSCDCGTVHACSRHANFLVNPEKFIPSIDEIYKHADEHHQHGKGKGKGQKVPQQVDPRLRIHTQRDCSATLSELACIAVVHMGASSVAVGSVRTFDEGPANIKNPDGWEMKTSSSKSETEPPASAATAPPVVEEMGMMSLSTPGNQSDQDIKPSNDGNARSSGLSRFAGAEIANGPRCPLGSAGRWSSWMLDRGFSEAIAKSDTLVRITSERLSTPVTLIWAASMGMLGQRISDLLFGNNININSNSNNDNNSNSNSNSDSDEKNLSDTTSILKVHVLGGGALPLGKDGAEWEEFLHILPHVKAVEITVFGCGEISNGKRTDSSVPTLCDSCQALDRKISMRRVRELNYTGYRKSLGSVMPDPDVVIIAQGDTLVAHKSFREIVDIAGDRAALMFTAWSRKSILLQAGWLAKGHQRPLTANPRLNPFHAAFPHTHPLNARDILWHNMFVAARVNDDKEGKAAN